MGHFRQPSLFFDPPMMTVITAGLGNMRNLKRMACARFTTSYSPLALSSLQQPDREVHRWIVDNIPSFTSSVKLYIDFPTPDFLHVAAAFQQVALRFNGHLQSTPTRSLGDSGKCKRRTLTVTFLPGFDTTENNALFFEFVLSLIHI